MSDYGAIIGGTIGAVVGGMTTFGAGAKWGWMIGSAIGGAWSASQQVIPGPKIGEVSQQTAQEGGPRSIVFGRSHPIAGNIIADGGPRIVVTRERQGKGGPKVESESAFRTYAVGFCEGPITAFLQVWKNNTLVYDIEDPSMEAENEEFLKYARFYLGDYDQMPSPDLEAVLGAGEVHGHRGTAYMVLADEDVTDQRGSWSQWKVRVARIVESQEGQWWAGRFPDGFIPDNRIIHRSGNDFVFGPAEVRPEPTVDIGLGENSSHFALRTSQGTVVLFGDNSSIEVYDGVEGGLPVTPPTIVQVATSGTGDEVSLRRLQRFDDVLVATFKRRGEFFVSYNGGYNWNPVPCPGGDGFFAGAVAKSHEDRWVCFSFSTPGESFHYSDGEFPTEWFAASSDGNDGPSTESSSAIYPCLSRFLMVGSNGRILSTPDGSHWSISPSGTVPSGSFGGGYNGDTVLLVQPEGDISYTRNAGISWSFYEDLPLYGTAVYGGGLWVLSGSRQPPAWAHDSDLEAWTLGSIPDPGVGNRWKVAYISPSQSYIDGHYPLPLLVSELCERAGLPSDLFDVSQLDGKQVRGFTTSAAHACHESLQALSQVFFFSPANIGGRVRFIPMGGDSVASISEDEMIDDDADVESDSRRGDSINIPRIMHLNYYDVLGGLNTDKQHSERPEGTRAEGEMSLQTAVVLSHDEAATVVSKNHAMMAETQKGELYVPLPDNYLFLTESDPIHVHYEGKLVRGVISESVVMDGEQRYRVVRDRQSIHTMNVEGLPPAPITPPPSSIVGATLLEVLDIPIVRDSDDALGVYIAVSGVMPAWQGALVELSMDGGQTYIEGHTVRADTIMGSLVTDLGDHPQAFPDTVNSVQVNVPTPYAVLEGTDLAGMMNRRNLAVIGDELVSFSEADEVSEGVWELSHFLRGRKGTDTESHAIGERFVMLSGAIFVPAELVMLDRPVTVRATSLGTDNETIVALTFTGQSQVERSPAYLQVRRDGADVVASWQGVGRIGGGAHVAMGQHFTGYRVTLTDGATTQTHNTPDSEFTGSMSAFSGPVTVRVQQRNNFTGLGPAIEVTI